MPTCFVIMPITTPEHLVEMYGDDHKHFIHVLEYLFVPAITKANLEPIRPIAQGADVIQAEIIKSLETADLVLCDISTLNPNVFFELGCRTALNKPVCYVKDDVTPQIPFDTGIVNHYEYSSTLAAWTIDKEIEDLASHIETTIARSEDKNKLWQYFGLRSTAHAVQTSGTEGEKLEYLLMQVESIKNSVEAQKRPGWVQTGQYSGDYDLEFTGFPSYTSEFLKPKRNWHAELSNAEHDYEEISRLRKAPRPAALSDVKFLINEHVKNLSELVDAAPANVDLAKARRLLTRFQSLLSGKER